MCGDGVPGERHFRTRGVAGVLLVIGCAAALGLFAPARAAAQAAETGTEKNVRPIGWPQFLGPDRNGVSTETGLLKAWPEDGPKAVFRVRGGVGMSGVSVADGRAVTLVQRGGKQLVVALDAKTGKTLHETAVASEYSNSMGNGPRATPALAGDTAYVFTGEGILAAVDLKQGKVVWSRKTVQELGGQEIQYGMASSPLVVGETVIVMPGAADGLVVAYDRKTGEPKWQAKGDGRDTMGYASPVLLQLGGTPQIVAFAGKAVLGLSPATGKELWRHPFVTDFDCNTALPIAKDGQVLISAGENHGSELLKIGAKSFAVESAWKSFGPESVLRSEWQTPILLDGYLYGMDNVGGAGPVTHFTCVEFATGKRMWQERRFGKGNLIAADGKLFLSTIKGELVVLRANPKKLDELGRAEVLGMTRQAPSLADGLLYLRDEKEIVCFDVRAAGP